MTPLSTKPTVVILLAPKGDEVMAVASNIAPVPATADKANDDSLTVKITRRVAEFKVEAANKPFDSSR
jgi:hypothetical protein